MPHSHKTPYMIITHYTLPAKGTRTQDRGWAKQEGKVVIRERVEFDSRLKRRDMTAATVVIDIHRREIVKNRVQDTFDGEVLIDHYFKKYNTQMAGFLADFLATGATGLQDAQ